MIIELKYGNTNTYLVKGNDKYILFDTNWAGTFNMFAGAVKDKGIKLQDIEYLFISHFHPDHMGIAGQLSEYGIKVVVCDVQKDYVHSSDEIFVKGKNNDFIPIDDSKVMILELNKSRIFLQNIGIEGEIIYTPGHSDDSVSMCLDDGSLLVGDLNPLYELEMHEGTVIGQSWAELLKKNPKKVYYGHAKTAILEPSLIESSKTELKGEEKYHLVSTIMKYIDKGYGIDQIQKKKGIDKTFISDVMRMYLTHQNVSVQGILDRIEIKNK